MAVLPRIAEFHAEMTEWRRDFHAHPEIGFEEVRTSGIVAEKLQSWGIEIERGFGKTGLVGIIHGKRPGNRKIGLRADMDALPMPELNDFAHRSTIPNRMHACGHDGHTTMLLGAARYLAETRNFSGTVHLIFQPAGRGSPGPPKCCATDCLRNTPATRSSASIIPMTCRWAPLPSGRAQCWRRWITST